MRPVAEAIVRISVRNRRIAAGVGIAHEVEARGDARIRETGAVLSGNSIAAEILVIGLFSFGARITLTG